MSLVAPRGHSCVLFGRECEILIVKSSYNRNRQSNSDTYILGHFKLLVILTFVNFVILYYVLLGINGINH